MYPKVGMYSHMKGDGSPFAPHGIIDPTVCREQAKFDHVILDAWPCVFYPQIITTLREMNPGIKLYAYVVQKWWPVQPLGDMSQHFPYQANLILDATNGKLWRTDGTPFDNWWNMASTPTINQLAALIHSLLLPPGRWDGLFLDVSCAQVTNIAASGIDFHRAGYATEADFAAAWSANHLAFAKALHTLPLIGNCGTQGESEFNGWTREDFPFQNAGPHEENWHANIFKNQWGQLGYLTAPYTEPKLSWISTTPNANQDATHQKVRFGLGSACLDSGIHTLGRNEWEPHRFWWYPEYDNCGIGKGWLGEPIEPYIPGSVFYRPFTKGAILVNPNFTPMSIYLPERFRSITGGGWKDAFSVPARDAMFLIR